MGGAWLLCENDYNTLNSLDGPIIRQLHDNDSQGNTVVSSRLDPTLRMSNCYDNFLLPPLAYFKYSLLDKLMVIPMAIPLISL